jgi:hypothetical protein
LEYGVGIKLKYMNKYKENGALFAGVHGHSHRCPVCGEETPNVDDTDITPMVYDKPWDYRRVCCDGCLLDARSHLDGQPIYISRTENPPYVGYRSASGKSVSDAPWAAILAKHDGNYYKHCVVVVTPNPYQVVGMEYERILLGAE